MRQQRRTGSAVEREDWINRDVQTNSTHEEEQHGGGEAARAGGLSAASATAARVGGLIILTVFGVERLKPAMAMIDDGLKFNQNGARGVFRGGKQANQSSCPSILPLIRSCFFLGTRPLLTATRHSSLSHQHLAPLPPSSSVRPSFPRHLLLHASTTSHMTPTPPILSDISHDPMKRNIKALHQPV